MRVNGTKRDMPLGEWGGNNPQTAPFGAMRAPTFGEVLASATRVPGVEVKSFEPPGGTHGQIFSRSLVLGGPDHVTRPFTQNVWVHLCLSLISDMASAVPLRMRREADPDSPQIERHPLLDLLARPNPFLTDKGLVKTLALHYLDDGESFWFLTGKDGTPWDSSGFPVQINPVRGFDVEDPREADINRVGDTIEIATWRTSSGVRRVEAPAGSVVQIKRSSPYSPIRGMGLVTALMRSIENDYTAQRFDDAVLRSGGTPSYAIVAEHHLTHEQLEAERKRWREKNRNAAQHQEPLFLSNGVKAQTLGLGPREMELQELRRWYRDQILAGFRVPLVLLGREVEGGFSRAGQADARLAFHEDVIAPMHRAWEAEMNANLLPKLGLEGKGYLYFDDAALTAESLDQLVERFTKLTNAGIPATTAAAMAGWQLTPDVEADLTAREDEKRAAREQLLAGAASSDEESPPPTSSDEERDASGTGRVTRDGHAAPALSLKAFDEALSPTDEVVARVLAETYVDFLDHVDETLEELAYGVGGAVQTVAVSHQGDPRSAVQVGGNLLTSADPISKEWTRTDLEWLFRDLEEWHAKIRRDVTPELARLFDEQVLGLLREIGLAEDFDSRFSARVPNAAGFIAAKELRLTETVDTLRDEVKTVILNGLNQNATISEISTNLRISLEGMQEELDLMRLSIPKRARLIARTETTSAANGSRVMTMQANGIEQHRWLSADPGADQLDTRKLHARLHGTAVRVGEVFPDPADGSVEHRLRWPGDPAADVGEIANCRCSTNPVIRTVEEAEADATGEA